MSRCDLSILCVTKNEPHARQFLDAMGSLAAELGAEWVPVVDGIDVRSAGYVESALDAAIERCSRDYVLRLDDDERCSRAMARWLEHRSYETANNWKFPRVHLWGDEYHALVTPHLWPDHQTRLAVKKFAGSRSAIHAGSPFGGGLEAPCAIEHWKFIVRPLEERRAIIARYDQIQNGAGSQFRPFQCPEEFYVTAELVASVRDWDGSGFARTAA